ncbi:hypothetical protein OIU79_005729 [Salix purpurea]|uniref:Uncharacterized protein n=1 Tax=Salix purpurea TaxID=77065 RepID=A0A9Q0TTK8_SALPP|nr:hypothetical protein OIU79_005729 [Salix purpurea]
MSQSNRFFWEAMDGTSCWKMTEEEKKESRQHHFPSCSLSRLSAVPPNHSSSSASLSALNSSKFSGNNNIL